MTRPVQELAKSPRVRRLSSPRGGKAAIRRSESMTPIGATFLALGGFLVGFGLVAFIDVFLL